MAVPSSYVPDSSTQLPNQLNEVSGLLACPWITCVLACSRLDSWVSTPSRTCAGIVPPPDSDGSENSPSGVYCGSDDPYRPAVRVSVRSPWTAWSAAHSTCGKSGW